MNAPAKPKTVIDKFTDKHYKEARIPWIICQAQRRNGQVIEERSFPFFSPTKDFALNEIREINTKDANKWSHVVVFGELIEARDKATTKVYSKKEEAIEI